MDKPPQSLGRSGRRGSLAHCRLRLCPGSGRCAAEILIYSTHIATPSLGLSARLDQIETILDDSGQTGPALVGGDLNTADPGSAGQVRELFADRDFEWASDHATGTGTAFGLYDTTLDYVFARELEPTASGTFDGEAGSDHKPISVKFDVPASGSAQPTAFCQTDGRPL